jgi:hypothetical protein
LQLLVQNQTVVRAAWREGLSRRMGQASVVWESFFISKLSVQEFRPFEVGIGMSVSNSTNVASS